MNDNIPLSALIPSISECLNSGKEVSLKISGASMRPLVYSGRDSVTLKAVTKPLKKHDVVLYRRNEDTFVLHRIIKIRGDELFICGDNCQEIETGIKTSDVIAIASKFTRNGKEIPCNSLKYKIYSSIWCGILPFRKTAKKINRKLRGSKNEKR